MERCRGKGAVLQTVVKVRVRETHTQKARETRIERE